jgi:HlyD family secretion protein
MNMTIGKPLLAMILVPLVIVVFTVLGLLFWSSAASGLPRGIVSGNGRLEAQLVDVVAKEATSVEKIFVAEGDLVKPGQVLAKLNTKILQAQLAEAQANVIATQKKVTIAQADIQRSKGQYELARIEARRAARLRESGAGSQRDDDRARENLKSATAAQTQAEAQLQAATQQVKGAQANLGAIQTRINESTLVSPVTGRVLYRLTEPGEVLAAGGKAMTLVDLSDVYMEIFLPSDQAAALKLGSEGRIVMDYLPDWALPARVTFVSPQAQFTPKQVETRSEREMLMFRVRLQIPRELVFHFIAQIKTGVRGVGYVKTDPSAVWPVRLSHLLSVDQKTLPPAGKP